MELSNLHLFCTDFAISIHFWRTTDVRFVCYLNLLSIIMQTTTRYLANAQNSIIHGHELSNEWINKLILLKFVLFEYYLDY